MNIIQEITTSDGTWSIEENGAGQIEIYHNTAKNDPLLPTVIPITAPVMELLALALRNHLASEAAVPGATTNVVNIREFWREVCGS